MPVDAGPGDDGGGGPDGGRFDLNCGVLGQENVAPQVIVWREFILYAEDPTGVPLTRLQWRLEDGAGGDGLRLESSGDSSTRAQVPRVGAWTFGVSAFRANGMEGHCVVSIQANPPTEGFFLQLAWEGDRDLDLHMVPLRPVDACAEDADCQGAGRQCNMNYCSMAFNTQTGADSDCWARQHEPDWVGEEGPRYTHDVRGGAGTEYISGRRFAPDSTYRVAVRTFGNRTNSATLSAWSDGQQLMPQESFRLGPAGGGGWYYVGRIRPAENGHQWVSVGELSSGVPRD